MCGPPAETVGLSNNNHQPCSVTTEVPAVRLPTAIRHTWSKSKDIPTPKEIETSQRNCSHVWRDLVWNMQCVFWLYLVLIMTCKAEMRNGVLHWVPPVRYELRYPRGCCAMLTIPKGAQTDSVETETKGCAVLPISKCESGERLEGHQVRERGPGSLPDANSPN